MKVKCSWITCIHNSTNEDYIKYNGKCSKSGLCQCSYGIVLSSDVICESCQEEVDALKCENYMFKGKYSK
jgi:hypothetical protein